MQYHIIDRKESFSLSFCLYKHAQKVMKLYSKIEMWWNFSQQAWPHCALKPPKMQPLLSPTGMKFRAHVNRTQKAVDHFEFSSQAPPTALMDFKFSYS